MDNGTRHYCSKCGARMSMTIFGYVCTGECS